MSAIKALKDIGGERAVKQFVKSISSNDKDLDDRVSFLALKALLETDIDNQ